MSTFPPEELSERIAGMKAYRRGVDLVSSWPSAMKRGWEVEQARRMSDQRLGDIKITKRPDADAGRDRS